MNRFWTTFGLSLSLILFMGVNAGWFLTLPPWGGWLGMSLAASMAFGLLFILEWLVFRAAGAPQAQSPWIAAAWGPFLVLHPLRFLLAHLPFPAPHDFFARKMEVAAGFVWVAHLFAFAMVVLWFSHRQKKAEPVKAFTILALFLFPALSLTTTWCDLTGDEPHYLLMAHSLNQDGDLNLADDYAAGKYTRFYGRGDLQPQALEHATGKGLYSHHPLGPVLLMLPGYALAGRFGAVLIMAFLSAWLLGQTLRLLHLSGHRPRILWMTGAVGLLSSPLLLYSGLLFPEVPTACLLVLFLRFRMDLNPRGMGFVLGLLPWFHNRNVLLALPLASVALWDLCRTPEMRRYFLGRLVAGASVPLALLLLYFRSVYGVWTPLGAHNEPLMSLFRLDRFFTGFFGLLFDQEAGLWFHFPVFAAVPAGILLARRIRDPLGLYATVTLLFYYFAMCFYENLGQTPAARFMVCLTPLLLFFLAPVFRHAKEGGRWWKLLGVLGGAGIVVNALLAAVPWMRYNKLEGENWMLKLAGKALHIPWTKWEPSFHLDPVPLRSWLLSLLWTAVIFFATREFLKKVIPPRRRGGAENDKTMLKT